MPPAAAAPASPASPAGPPTRRGSPRRGPAPAAPPQDAADVALRDPFRLGDLGDRAVGPGIQLARPASAAAAARVAQPPSRHGGQPGAWQEALPAARAAGVGLVKLASSGSLRPNRRPRRGHDLRSREPASPCRRATGAARARQTRRAQESGSRYTDARRAASSCCAWTATVAVYPAPRRASSHASETRLHVRIS